MLILPFRTKNPAEAFPYCTLAIIAINFVVFLLTTHSFVVTEYSISALAVSYNTLNPWRLLTSIFLHENALHILGNMLFLWMFGPAVEGRLKPIKYLLVYFSAGMLGGWIFQLIVGAQNPDQWDLGASGAIMGVLGAYLYMFPHSRVTFGLYIFLLLEWPAMWLIGLFVAQDIFLGYIFHFEDGIGHVAHLAGFALGFILALALRPHTDSENYSRVKSTLSELKNVEMLTLRELDILVRQPGASPAHILAYCRSVAAEYGERGYQRAASLIRRQQRLLIEEADPSLLASFLLTAPLSEPVLPPVVHLRIGTRLEQARDYDQACRIYRRVYDLDPSGRDAETALFRLGRLLETVYSNPQAAVETYCAQLRLFPKGSMAQDANAALARANARLAGAKPGVGTSHGYVPHGADQPTPAVEGAAETPDRPPDPQNVDARFLGSGRILEI
jgi:membrane associated rhomboid family serine protease